MNKDSRAYAVAFTVVLCCLCAGLLAAAHMRWRDVIEANGRFERIRAIVDATGILADLTSPTRSQVEAAYDRCISERPCGRMRIYEAALDGQIVAHAFDMIGYGYEGRIKGIVAVDPSKKKIIALRIYEQHETPGLGGLIGTRRWQDEFVGKPLASEGSYGLMISRTETGENVFPWLSKASKTSFSVAQLLNSSIAEFLSGGRRLMALDLDLEGNVSKATPGYPREWVRPPHLREENLKLRRPDFMVPEGCALLSVGKPVTSSMDDEPIIGDLAQITDGTKKCEEGDFVELDEGIQWVQIDLGQPRTIYAIAIWPYYKNPIVYKDMIVSIADDADFTENVRVLFNNDHDDSSGCGRGQDTAFFARWWAEIVDARGPDGKGMPARYVRVQTNGSTGDKGNCFVEIAVYGK